MEQNTANGMWNMEDKEENSAYIGMLLNSLRRKEKILISLLDYTKVQETLLKDSTMDEDEFQETVDKKGKLLNELEEIDGAFNTVFERVEQEVKKNPGEYKEEILEMQELVPKVTELGLQIQALEHQNSEHFKTYLAEQRRTIRDFHTNRKTAMNYYQNMPNTHKLDESYFFNKTK